MMALLDPGGLVRQVWFTGPSGGQDTTGNFAWKLAVPDSASVPPAHPMITIIWAEVLYFSSVSCSFPGCLCAEQMRVCTVWIPTFLQFSSILARCGASESLPAIRSTTPGDNSFAFCRFATIRAPPPPPEGDEDVDALEENSPKGNSLPTIVSYTVMYRNAHSTTCFSFKKILFSVFSASSGLKPMSSKQSRTYCLLNSFTFSGFSPFRNRCANFLSYSSTPHSREESGVFTSSITYSSLVTGSSPNSYFVSIRIKPRSAIFSVPRANSLKEMSRTFAARSFPIIPSTSAKVKFSSCPTSAFVVGVKIGPEGSFW
mmetsp:Transcript_9942/g.24602  ORF Transcript_9942/g.24602 Transcript_9942/m.24602 type:complete len:315 (-) Transcript_9942:51-995(-)